MDFNYCKLESENGEVEVCFNGEYYRANYKLDPNHVAFGHTIEEVLDNLYNNEIEEVA